MVPDAASPRRPPHVTRAALAVAPVLSLAPAVVIVLAGCESPLVRAENAFRSGDYPRAKQELADLEWKADRWAPRRAAEFALYRGLTFSALGDRARAERWLRYAETLERARPGTLSTEDAARLETAIEASGP